MATLCSSPLLQAIHPVSCGFLTPGYSHLLYRRPLLSVTHCCSIWILILATHRCSCWIPSSWLLSAAPLHLATLCSSPTSAGYSPRFLRVPYPWLLTTTLSWTPTLGNSLLNYLDPNPGNSLLLMLDPLLLASLCSSLLLQATHPVCCGFLTLALLTPAL